MRNFTKLSARRGAICQLSDENSGRLACPIFYVTKCSPPSESHSVTLTALARVIITVLNNTVLIGSHKVSKLSYWLLYVAVVM